MMFRISMSALLVYMWLTLAASANLMNNEGVFDQVSVPPRNRRPPSNDQCPPCFNCMLPIFECKQFSECNSFNGRCECIDGFGGDDCSVPLCGALSSGNSKRPLRSNETNTCECESGWGGINCNICEEDYVCDAFMPSGLKGTCNKNGMIAKSLHQGCDVTNPKILEILKGSKPQVTFACNKTSELCNFQFWIDQVESFYCGLDTCSFEYDLQQNTTHYKCDNVKCKCVPGQMLCGKKGSIDISDFLTETIKGPGDFSCDLESKKCQFSEPSMNDLILTVFGDPYITLKCESGECLHYSEIPGYKTPDKSKLSTGSILVLVLSSAGVLVAISISVYFISKSPIFANSPIMLPDDSSDDDFDLYKTNSTATLTFENITYKVFPTKNTSTTILNEGTGSVKPGEMLAIMGGSGAGKTTLLDILAKKNKTGKVTGSIKVNGTEIDKEEYSKIIGFVDQDDYLLPTSTVYETVLNSALLRLPRQLSFKAKQKRVYDVLEQLRIYDIKDRVIGSEYERGISGGEKRRVSIACELVTSPQVLFLDEPTSGLDANNANNVIECLVRLANHYNKTLVVSIHQPRSSIFQLFDKLVLLSDGEMVYSGEAYKVSEFLKNEGYVCPQDYNIADYLIDVTFEPSKFITKATIDDVNATIPSTEAQNPIHRVEHVRRSLTGTATQTEWEHLAIHRDEFRGLLAQSENEEQTIGEVNSQLLHSLFKDGQYFQKLKFEINELSSSGTEEELRIPHAYKAATFMQQVSILSSRTFKNVYRNPKLLLGNYMLTIFLGFFLGTLYYDVDNDISGFQNRLGLFFFILTYFGFLTFTGLSSFALERLIFIKERSNHYYSPLAYYMAKVISDIFPLRVVPPILLGLIIYPLVGLNMANNGFGRFILILVLFNLAVSLEILTVGIIFEDLNNSIIVSVLIILASLLFSGLFINTKDIENYFFKYLKNLSVFYYAYESLIINEVKSLMLREKKYGLNIEIPGATILSTFGFIVQNFVFDIEILVLFNVLFLVLGYLALQLIVVEQK